VAGLVERILAALGFGVYAGIAAMVLGAIAAVSCRPDLKADTLLGGVLFLALYSIFLLGLKWSAPGYIEQVWNLNALSGIVIYGLPIEELLFGFSFGLVWTGIYEHFTWKRSVTELPPPGSRHRRSEAGARIGDAQCARPHVSSSISAQFGKLEP
jgi:hypothetical protein